jgi:hypothetical protein
MQRVYPSSGGTDSTIDTISPSIKLVTVLSMISGLAAQAQYVELAVNSALSRFEPPVLVLSSSFKFHLLSPPDRLSSSLYRIFEPQTSHTQQLFAH